MKTFIAVGVSIAALVGVMYYASVRDAALERVADCIYHEARAAHYPDIYSAEAWNTFAPLCVKK